MAELTDLRSGDRSTRTIAIESADPARVIAAVDELGLSSRVNTNIPRALQALALPAEERPAYPAVSTALRPRETAMPSSSASALARRALLAAAVGAACGLERVGEREASVDGPRAHPALGVQRDALPRCATAASARPSSVASSPRWRSAALVADDRAAAVSGRPA
jgi:hypothetical protein